MNYKTKYALNEEVYFISFPSFKIPDLDSAKIHKGVISEIRFKWYEFDEGNELKTSYHITYDDFRSYIKNYSREIPDERIFKTKKKAEMYLCETFIKGKK